MFSPQDF
jgi:hypothetical protein